MGHAGRGRTRGSDLGRAALAVGGLGAVALIGALAEAHGYVVRRARVPVLPAGSETIRLLHISDLHLVPRQRRKAAWVRALAELEPDLVIDTGDNFAHADGVPAVLHALEPLLARPGAFVLGSNDYFAPKPKNPSRYLLPDPRVLGVADTETLPTDDLVSGLVSGGWRDLTNRRDAVVVKGIRFELVGVDDPHLDRDVFPSADGGAAATRAGELPSVRLGVAHAPYRRVLNRMKADGSDLILAGHTHGGQLCLPFVGALVTNCDLDRGRAKGLHGWPGARPDEPGGEASTWLHVSAGLGTSPYAPVRSFCRPEVTLLDLVAR